MAITATKLRANARKTTNGFWWADYMAKDIKGALDFYTRVLGWDTREESDPDGNVIYNTALVNDLKVAGLGQMMEQQLSSGMPSMWTNYVTVEDAAATCATAKQLGGTVMMEPMEVNGEGTMAIILDPNGAAFGIWQNGRHTGADAVNQPGAYTWVELASSNVEAALEFYGNLFGWTWEKQDFPQAVEVNYHMFRLDGEAMAGIMSKPVDMAQAPDMWSTWWGVADIQATKAEVEAAGGTVVFGPMTTGPGEGMGVMDPQGGFVSFIQMSEWPTD
ncbi:MAG: Glyoxalase/bleomycin resistance protein/dioxygenase [Thermoleophilia bacterium]|nr:Glyoxalase/bleomycin resistance protein/dioxygenase [Thermoleophilia bacterium]